MLISSVKYKKPNCIRVFVITVNELFTSRRSFDSLFFAELF